MANFPNYYNFQPYQQQFQYQPQQMQTVPQQANNSNGINWVQGETGAKSYLVLAGQTVLLMDSEKNCFYIKQADNAGMPMPLRIFDYTERTAQAIPTQQVTVEESKYVTKEEYNSLLERIESLEKKPVKKGATNESTL